MSKVKWIHLSDLHFGVEKQIKEVSTIREKLFEYLGKLKRYNYKYLFISGDIFYAPYFFNIKAEDVIEKNKIIDKAITFILKLIHELNIDRENVFIVPGNHDTNRMITIELDGTPIKKKEEYIGKIKKNYSNTENLNITELTEYQKDFNQFCEKINNVECENYKKYDESKESMLIEKAELKKINYCNAGHKLVKKGDIDVLMLNSSLTSCQDRDELLLGVNLLRDELKKIEQNHWNNDSFPLFVLSHHYTECFKDKHILITDLKEKKDTILYLCGHEHAAEIRNVDGIDFLQCGTYVSKEKENDFKPNEVSFLTGSFNEALSETKVFFHKWHSRQRTWMENRDMAENVPHNMKIIEKKDNHKKYVLSSKSESEAVKEFFKYLKALEAEAIVKNIDDKYTFLINKINKMLDLIEGRHKAWKFKDKFKEFNLETNFEGLQKKIEIEHKNHENVKKQINSHSKINILAQKINKKRAENPKLTNIGILLYSKSVRVTDYLKRLLESVPNIDMDVYICSVDIRSANNLYQDGYDIAYELYDDTIREFRGIKEIQLIPDIYVERLMRERKIQFVLMGAHSLYFGGNSFTDFSNTTGSKLIIDLAIINDAECLIIAEKSKADNIYPVEICEEKIIIGEFSFPATTSIKAEFYHHEVVNIKDYIEKDLVTIITDTSQYPWEDSPKLTSDTIERFINKILKDRRKLKLNDKNTTIEKHFLSEDKRVEINVLETLLENGTKVPNIREQKKDCIVLDYYKGIRVFNMIVSIDNLKGKYSKKESEEFIEKCKILDRIIENILKRCEDNQKKIQLALYEEFKNSTEISIYPQEKLTDIIELLFSCIKLEGINKDTVIREMNTVYQYFKEQAKVPFRDASVKNMILVNDDLYLDKFADENERDNYIYTLFKNGKLEEIIEKSDIIDIDFSACINYTTLYDDIISFRFHERTAPYFPKDIEIWNNELMNNESVNTNALVATFIIRFLRFGGRKLLYRIIAPDLREKRFKHDKESYYFEKLQEIIKQHKITYLSESIKLFEKIKNILTTENRKTFFIIQYDDENIKENIKEISRKESYSDVFPY